MSNAVPTAGGAQALASSVPVNIPLFAPGPIGTPLATGLGGAIGSDYRPARSHLLFVEFAGRLSRLSLIPSATVVSSGTAVIKGTYLFDFDTGQMSGVGEPIHPPYDVWWEQETSTARKLVPESGARLHRLGAVDYAAITHAELLGLAYGTAAIDGSVGAANQLADGTVFAVRTSQGNYAKVKVVAYGYDLKVQWTTWHVDPAYKVLGTGYSQPEDVKVSADEKHAYVTERTGTLLRVDLAAANRASAEVIASGLTAPHQIHLDEARNQAFVVEFNTASPAAGRLVRIDLGTHAQTTVAGGLQGAVGLVVTQDLQFAYVSEQTTGPDQGRVVRIRLDTGHREVIAKGLTAPFFLTWTDPGETGILVAERDPANRVTRIDLSSGVVTKQTVLPSVAFRPSSVAVTSPTELLVCSDQEIGRYQLTASVFHPAGPVLLGIGHVPVDRISRSSPPNPLSDGYADTTADPGYFFQVKDAPFGGTLAVMLNHDRAFADGARFYKLMVDGVEVKQGWTDYRWSTSTNHFEAQFIAPGSAGFYRVRPPSELWYNHWLGFMLDTGGLSNGLHTLAFRLFGAETLASELGSSADAGRSVLVRVDNTVPFVAIDKITHDGAPVNTCAIVSGGTDQFVFTITASESQQHLRDWSLVALWGDNRSGAVASDSYAAHVSPSKKWGGLTAAALPVWHATVAGDPSSTHCAHTFYLTAASRAIDGWNYLYSSSYHKSVTLMVP